MKYNLYKKRRRPIRVPVYTKKNKKIQTFLYLKHFLNIINYAKDIPVEETTTVLRC